MQNNMTLSMTVHDRKTLVHVLHTGPVNSNDEYDYVVMSTNCNYPIYVFARDPVAYKQASLSKSWNFFLEKYQKLFHL